MTDTTRKTVKVDLYVFNRARLTIDAMQGKTFYCEDEDGCLRRWYPPAPIKHLSTAERSE